MSVHQLKPLQLPSEEEARAKFQEQLQVLQPIELTADQVKAIMHKGEDYSKKAMRQKETDLAIAQWRLGRELVDAREDIGKDRARVVNSVRRIGKVGLVVATVGLAGSEPDLAHIASALLGLGGSFTVFRAALAFNKYKNVAQAIKNYGDEFTFTSPKNLEPTNERSPTVVRRAIRNRKAKIAELEVHETDRPEREYIRKQLDRKIERLFIAGPGN